MGSDGRVAVVVAEWDGPAVVVAEVAEQDGLVAAAEVVVERDVPAVRAAAEQDGPVVVAVGRLGLVAGVGRHERAAEAARQAATARCGLAGAAERGVARELAGVGVAGVLGVVRTDAAPLAGGLEVGWGAGRHAAALDLVGLGWAGADTAWARAAAEVRCAVPARQGAGRVAQQRAARRSVA